MVVGVGDTEGELRGPLTLVSKVGLGVTEMCAVGLNTALVLGCSTSCDDKVVVGVILTVGDTDGEALELGIKVSVGAGVSPGCEVACGLAPSWNNGVSCGPPK